MKKTIFFLFLLSVLCLTTQSQVMYRPSEVEIRTLPAWAQEMYSASPNVFQVDALYKDYYNNHDFVKSYHTQYYKRWRREVEGRIDAYGFVIPFSLTEESKNDNEYRSKLLQSSHAKSSASWSAVGPYQVYDNTYQPANDQTNVYTIDQCISSPNILYSGTEPGEVYKSTDGAASWRCVSMGENFNGGISALEVDPTNPNIVFAGSSTYVKRSTDGGLTWSTVLTASGLNANEILINDANTQIVLSLIHI